MSKNCVFESEKYLFNPISMKKICFKQTFFSMNKDFSEWKSNLIRRNIIFVDKI